jgi:hypothetical protein
LIIVHIEDDIVSESGTGIINWEKTNALPSLLEKYISSIPIFVDLVWAFEEKNLDLSNTDFKKIINGITAKFRGKTPAEMNDEQYLTHRRNIRQKNIGISLVVTFFIIAFIAYLYANQQFNRADRQYKRAESSRLAAESFIELPRDNTKAIRIAEAAYEKGLPDPPLRAYQALAAAGYSVYEEPFYIANLKHKAMVYSAVFSPDGTRILTASYDGTAKLWDIQGNLLADLNKHKNVVWSAVFSPDGTRILTTSADGTAKVWYIPEAIYQWLKTAPISKLSETDKEELGIK